MIYGLMEHIKTMIIYLKKIHSNLSKNILHDLIIMLYENRSNKEYKI